jgi:hypothetical protein
MICNDILYRKEPFLVSKKTPIPLLWGAQRDSVRGTWQAQAAPKLAARAAAIPVERAAHPPAVADHSPPSAAVASRAGSGAAEPKLGKQPVPAPRGSGGVASTQDAQGGAGGSRSPASTPAVAFQHVRMGTVINDGYACDCAPCFLGSYRDHVLACPVGVILSPRRRADVVQCAVDDTPLLAREHGRNHRRVLVERGVEPLAHRDRQVRVRGALRVTDAAGDADQCNRELLARARGRLLER